jgi:hypothetical protein
MTGSPSRRRLTTIVAASLWLVLAFLVWNVCFDYGVRMAQFRFLGARSAYLSRQGAASGNGEHHVAGHRPIGMVGHHCVRALCRGRNCRRIGRMAKTYVEPG